MAFGIYDLYRAFQPGFRQRRIQLLLDWLHPGPQTRILDVGGYIYDWEPIPVTSPVTFLNLSFASPGKPIPDRFRCIVGDGRKMELPDKAFDLVFSNSVIEHVGSHEEQKRFAAELRRVGRQLFVQTPNRWFFIEPHFGALFIHFLPGPIARRLLRLFSFRALFRRGDNIDLCQLAEELRLLSFKEMKELFPDCEICREKWFGLTKSFIAIRKE
jgi:hypothetical protein